MKKLLILMVLVSIPFLIHTSALGQNINDQIQNLNFINRIIMQPKHCESLLSDTNYANRNYIITNNSVTPLIEHIKENSFDKGYDIISIMENKLGDSYPNKLGKVVRIVVRSRKNEEIIHFIFDNEEYNWKLSGWGFCLNNNERRPDNDVPCKKK